MNDGSQFNEILDGPDSFKCKHFNARMLKKACVQRQNEYNSLYIGHSRGFLREPFSRENTLSLEVCRDCEQGKKIRAGIMKEITSPKRGKGERKTDCQFYDDCLSHAAKKNWKTFHCEGCDHYGGENRAMAGEPENDRICSECNENRTITPKHSLCSSCMGKRSNEAKKKPKKGPVKPKKKNVIHDKPKKEKPSRGGDTAITVEFGEHVSILKEVEALADKEVRPLNHQVIFMLKEYLEQQGGEA